MTFSRRLRLYLFGVLLGGMLAWLFYGQRLMNGAWTPESRVKLRLYNTLTRATPAAQEQLRYWGFTTETLRAAMKDPGLDLGGIDRRNDSMLYTFEGTVHEKHIRFTVATLRDYRVDSTATLMELRAP